MNASEPTGLELARRYADEVVVPLLAKHHPRLPFAIGRLGSGSDVLGLDDAMSCDHDWGLRLSLFVPADAVTAVDADLVRLLPESFRGYPTRFAFSGQSTPRHHVEVSSVDGFLDARLGFDPRAEPTVADWLSLSGQSVLEVTAGPVFSDAPGDLTAARRALAWYPDDVWRYVLAADWVRIEQELPLMARAADVGDDLGSRLIAARLAHTIMHLGFLLERRWPPYAKWFGTLFARLAVASEMRPALDRALTTDDARERQQSIADALEPLLRLQNDLGLTSTPAATIAFWDRPYLHPDPGIVSSLTAGIGDPVVRDLPRGRGSIEQRTDNVDVLVDPRARRAAVS